jgi:hypothetical protein
MPTRMSDILIDHNWPVVHRVTSDASWRDFKTAIDTGVGGVVMSCPFEEFHVTALKQGWGSLLFKEQDLQGLDTVSVIESREMLLNFVSYCISQPYSELPNYKSLWLVMRGLYNRWLKQYVAAVRPKRFVHPGVRGHQNLFPRLIQRLHARGHLQISESKRYAKDTFYRVDGSQSIFIPLASLRSLLKGANLDVITISELKLALNRPYGTNKQRVKLIEDAIGPGGAGWKVSTEWLLNEKVEVDTNSHLKIVG